MKIFAFEKNYNGEFWWYISLLLFSIVLLYLIFLSNWFKKILLALSLPGPRALPILGNCLIATNNQELLALGKNAHQKYGRIFRIWISFLPMFVITEPKDLQTILNTQKNTEKTFFYSLMHNFLGNGLITNSGKKWRLHRKILQPAFHINILETFLDTFIDSSTNIVQQFENSIKISSIINITNFINNCVLNILNEAVLGVPIKNYNNNNNLECALKSPFREGKVLAQNRIIRPWLLFDCIYNLTNNGKFENNQKENLKSFTRMLIKKTVEERQNGIFKRDRTYLLDKMLDIQMEYPEFTNEDIENELCTFMLAGQESVATSVSFCLYYLAKYKQIQEQVFNEQKQIFHKNFLRKPTINDLNEMKYLEQCVKETLRLCPSVPIMARKLGESIQIGKYNLPIGSDVLISPYITQHIEKIFPEPEKFMPERFSSENIQKRHHFSFVSFSAGPRNCIGSKFAMIEMKTLISYIVRNFELDVKNGYELKLGFRITLRAQGGIWLKFKPRT